MTRMRTGGRIVFLLGVMLPLAARPACAAGPDEDQPRPCALPAGVDERVCDLRLADGKRQRILFSMPAHARGTIVMFPGGAGDLELGRDGTIGHPDNFVVRTRALWNRHGYGVLVPDTIDRASLRGRRSSPAYARIAGVLVGFAHEHMAGPVFLLGTSQGAIAAMNGAAHGTSTAIAGVVLTESVSVMGGSGETVFDADPRQVRVPALIVANRNDRCTVAPPQSAGRIAAAMTGSPGVRVLTVSSVLARSKNPCGSLTPHGYYGIEPALVDAISTWMNAQG